VHTVYLYRVLEERLLIRFLVNKTNRWTELQIYWYYYSKFFGLLSAHNQEFLAVHRLWYILCSCDEPFAARSRMELQSLRNWNLKWIQSRLCRNFMDIAPYIVIGQDENFGGTSCLHFQGKKFTSKTITSYFLYLLTSKNKLGNQIQSML